LLFKLESEIPDLFFLDVFKCLKAKSFFFFFFGSNLGEGENTFIQKKKKKKKKKEEEEGENRPYVFIWLPVYFNEL
jgi:hypothetical protein